VTDRVDAFKVHRQLIEDYKSFTEGFVDIRDPDLREAIKEQSLAGAQWPDPWISLNPSFAPGGRVDQLVSEGVLDPRCTSIFSAKGSGQTPTPFSLYQHQRDAIEAARAGDSYVLTTGTGSGKSLAYIVPIVDRVLRDGSGKGIRAIVVYPMNALANSQVEELDKFLALGFDEPPVTYRRYTGQEQGEARQDILDNPPDILLTNYVMLELMLTRPDERRFLQQHAKALQFLVLDELHTYRGRQGADVAMLVRRIRELTGSGGDLQCVGTSATMSSGTTVAAQQEDVAGVASRIFGTPVASDRVIVETLVRATTVRHPVPTELAQAATKRGRVEYATALNYDDLVVDPLASWIEDTFGITEEPASGRLVRRPPTTVKVASKGLATLTGLDDQTCGNAIRATLMAGSAAEDASTGRSLFAFRLHQFLSKGGSIFVTPELPGKRHITADYQLTVTTGEQAPDVDAEKRLYPLAFCRECGQDYLMVRIPKDAGDGQFVARHLMRPADQLDGYLFLSTEREWPVDPVAEDRLPLSWRSGTAGHPIVPARRGDVPRRVLVSPSGEFIPSDQAGVGDAQGRTVAAFIPGAFRFCLHCGVTYEGLRTSELAKLVTLDKEGRSSAMSVIASSVVRALRAPGDDQVPPEARKLLTFVDNRQDASLQAGHFNDFVQVVQLRAALYQAVLAADPDAGLDILDLGRDVAKAMNLELSDFALAPDPLDDRPIRRALMNVVEYRALRDLQRGFRVTLPNLEQTGLVRVVYPSARRLAERDDRWIGTHHRLENLPAAQREEVVHVLLDELRRVLAIDAEGLTQDNVDRLRRESREYLAGVLAVGENEPEPVIGIAVPESGKQGGARSILNLTGRSAFGRWLRSLTPFKGMSAAEADDVIRALVSLLHEVGVLAQVTELGTTGYRVKSSAMTLFSGDGQGGAPDPVRRTFGAEHRPRVVAFFRDLYVDSGHQLRGLRAAEHTAQVRADDRERREKQFRTAELPLLFCSPTMELGVDIASLNAVALRNVPPTPANYAQRSGRAGRSGQQALVVTYCSSGNSHDSYYFERSHQMVAGKVTPPRLDLANEDLVRSHIHALWLAEALALTPAGLQSSMASVLDLGHVDFPVRAELAAVLGDDAANRRARETARHLLEPLRGELANVAWWSDEWPDRVVDRASTEFDVACNRWRELYRSAVMERDVAEALAADHSKHKDERRDADRRRTEARQRIELLLNESDTRGQSDFYTYRYLASEGFLPGYSFPRLPLAAYIPGSRRGAEGSWLQRPRFLAINEFGPNALIYHEGARYQVTRIALPRGSSGDGAADVVRTRLKVCQDCGYHHEADPGPDLCEMCDARLGQTWTELLQLQTVITRRRERISADEEERNRVGYELHTTYRYVPRGTHKGLSRAAVADADGTTPIAEVTYGDSAELRVTNLGRRNRANQNLQGFWLDLVKGRWLSEVKGEQQVADSDDEGLEAAQQDVKAKARVIPYVKDRRNIVVLRWERPLEEDVAITLQYALERGMEIAFQLEDSELSSELLPDAEGRGRVLFVESAEGGAGVLRRLQAEPDAVATVARAALDLIHVDPATGEEAKESCIRGCYRCLLSYGNQTVHERIDRRTAVPILRRLARAVTTSTSQDAGRSPVASTSPPDADAASRSASGHDERPVSRAGRPSELESWLRAAELALPTAANVMREGTVVDLVYDQTSPPAAILFDAHPERDVTDLVFAGFNVIRVSAHDDLWDIVVRNPAVFGTPTHKPATPTATQGPAS
jgi:superfamily II DNA/RNA helicase